MKKAYFFLAAVLIIIMSIAVFSAPIRAAGAEGEVSSADAGDSVIMASSADTVSDSQTLAAQDDYFAKICRTMISVLVLFVLIYLTAVVMNKVYDKKNADGRSATQKEDGAGKKKSEE